MFPFQAVGALLKKGEPPSMVRKDKANACGATLAQLSLKQGLKTRGERAKASATKEIQQMHDMSAFSPINVRSLQKTSRRSFAH